jgi:uncharacterized protein YecE (DUF72 family)
MNARIHIGCSGWVYRHWRGLFYPEKLPQRAWFAHYSAQFETVELNTSFYHLPKPETFDSWREQAPAGFRYAVKAPRLITHFRKLKECDDALAEFLGRAERLGEAIGPILYQLPPRWAFDRARLEAFADLLPRRFDHVFEFRQASWMTTEVIGLLDRLGVSHCVHDMPGMAVPRLSAGPVAYVRFHGAGGKYWGRYPEAELARWADWMLAEAARGRSVWAYFNNDIHGDAIWDAAALRGLVASRGNLADAAASGEARA